MNQTEEIREKGFAILDNFYTAEEFELILEDIS